LRTDPSIVVTAVRLALRLRLRDLILQSVNDAFRREPPS